MRVMTGSNFLGGTSPIFVENEKRKNKNTRDTCIIAFIYGRVSPPELLAG